MQLKQKGKCVTSRGIKQFAYAKLATQRLHISLFNMQKKFSKCLSRRGKMRGSDPTRGKMRGSESRVKKEVFKVPPPGEEKHARERPHERKNARERVTQRKNTVRDKFCVSKLFEVSSGILSVYQPSSISQLLRARSLSLSERPSGIRYSLLMLPSEI